VSAKNKKNLGIHFGLFLAEFLCVSAFTVELARALSGNELSWAYVFEWPLFAVYALYMWRKLLNEERNGPRPLVVPDQKSHDALERYNEYLRSVHDPTVEEHTL